MSIANNKWYLASRPKTLPASLIPVLIGASIAYYDGNIKPLYLIITFICALLIQIITNFINEIYDYKKGADNHERLGPKRLVASGEISIKTMKNVSTSLIIITFLLGLILVYEAGWIILAIGIFSLLFAYLYTAGPFPLAYKGFGDLFVFIFFGVLAVCGTYYIQTHSINMIVIISSFAPGFLSMNILGINNLRDIETDKKVGKMTLQVRLGKKNSQLMIVVLTVFTFLLPFAIGHLTQSLYNLLPLLSIIFAISLIKQIFIKTGKELNEILANSGKLLVIYGLLTSIGFILAKLM